MSIVTRFAPSPTGFLHVGGARTAIFSWLLARANGGKFILRIEDTDLERSTEEAKQAILDGMEWLGLDHDEIFYQAQRADRHNAAIDALLASGNAYYCDCSPEKVEQMREKARAEGRKPKYDGCCRKRGLDSGEGRVVRLKAPQNGATQWVDHVKGPISINNEELDDLILRRSDGSPTYNLAVVVDDSEMGVTTVLRGEDHIPNTPRQILIYKALGLDVPTFGHVPMILGPDKKKLSKRHGATSVIDYKDQGILPEAMFNYLVRLGWSFGDEEILPRERLLEIFTTDNLGSSAAVFDMDKLHWLNAHYIKESDPARLAALLMPILAQQGIAADSEADVASLVPMFVERAKTLIEMAQAMDFFFMPDDQLAYDDKAAGKNLTEEGKGHLANVRDRLAALEAFEREGVEHAVKGYVSEEGLKFKQVGPPLRIAASGRMQSPDLIDMILALGKDRIVARINAAIAY